MNASSRGTPVQVAFDCSDASKPKLIGKLEGEIKLDESSIHPCAHFSIAPFGRKKAEEIEKQVFEEALKHSAAMAAFRREYDPNARFEGKKENFSKVTGMLAKALGVPEKVAKHQNETSLRATELGRQLLKKGAKLNLTALARASRVHDLAKHLPAPWTFHHATLAAALLRQHNFDEEARLVENHLLSNLLSRPLNEIPLEEKILILADNLPLRINDPNLLEARQWVSRKYGTRFGEENVKTAFKRLRAIKTGFHAQGVDASLKKLRARRNK